MRQIKNDKPPGIVSASTLTIIARSLRVLEWPQTYSPFHYFLLSINEQTYCVKLSVKGYEKLFNRRLVVGSDL